MAYTTDMIAGCFPQNSITAVTPPSPSGWAGITKEPNGMPSTFQAGASYAITTDKFAGCVCVVALAFSH